MRWIIVLATVWCLGGCTPTVSPDAEADRALDLAKQGRLTESLEAFGAALAADPNHPKALYNQGMALMGLQRWDEAAASFSRFVDQRPEDPSGWFEKARAEVLAGEREPGLHALQRAVSLGFSDYDLLIRDGVFMPLFRDVRFVALEMTVAQRAGVEPDAGSLALRGATLGPGSHILPTMKLPGMGGACAMADAGNAAADGACEVPE